MNNILAFVILSMMFILSGYSYARLIGVRTKVEHYALSFIIGSGITTFIWFLFYLLGNNLTVPTLFISSLVSANIGFFLFQNFDNTCIGSRVNGFNKILARIVFVLLGLSILVSVYSPIVSWDSLTLYDFRGTVIANSHSLVDIESTTYLLSYPLMTSLIHAAVYMLGGNNPQLFYSLLLTSLIGIIYGRMYIWTNSRYSVLTALLVVSNPFIWQHATISYTNLPYAVFMLAGLCYAPTSLFLSGILIGLSTWVRVSEPFWILGLLFLLYYGIRQKKIFVASISVTIAYLIKYTWSSYLANAYIRSDLIGAESSQIYNFEMFGKIVANIGSITSYISQFILMPYLGIWVVTIFSLISSFALYKKRIVQYSTLPLLIVSILITLMVVAGIAIFSTYYSSWYSIGGSATRMLLFMVPLVIVVAMQLLYLLKAKNDTNIK